MKNTHNVKWRSTGDPENSIQFGRATEGLVETVQASNPGNPSQYDLQNPYLAIKLVGKASISLKSKTKDLDVSQSLDSTVSENARLS